MQATAKEVLEDGLLGDIQYNGNFSRQDAPAITVVQNKEGEPVVLQTEATEYIEAVQSIVVNGNWQALSKDKYSIDKEAGTITIEADVFKAGEEYKLTVDATGYKSQSIAFTYDKVLENDLSLTVDYADDKEAFAAEKKEDSNKTYYFADAEFTVNGSKGDFLKNLKSVTLLSDEEDAVERNIYTKGVSSSNDVYYEVSGDGKKLILHQVQPGTYKLTLRSNYYTEALRCEFVVEKEEEEIPDEQEIEIGASEIRKANGYGEKGYVIQFTYSDGTGMKPSDFAYKKALEEYVKSINSVVVGTTKYSPQSGWTLGDNEYASDIYDDANWLIDVVENLLSITRLNDGRLKIKFTDQLLDEVIAESLRHISRKHEDYQIDVECEEFILVHMDVRLIIQVLVNLIDNAIKYTLPGSKICIRGIKKDGQAQISVADNGPGISDEVKPHIFEMFYTGNNTIADSHRSLGLGLSLCRSIIEAHGGTLVLTDNIPRGCIFTFTLPLSEVILNE